MLSESSQCSHYSDDVGAQEHPKACSDYNDDIDAQDQYKAYRVASDIMSLRYNTLL